MILSALPSSADAAPMRPPRRRYSSVSTANQIFVCSAAVVARATTCSTLSPPRAAAAAASTTRPWPPQALRESTISMRRCPPRAAISAAAWRADSQVPGDLAAEVDRDDVVAGLDERLVDLEEVADRRLRGRRQVAAGAQALVERVEAAHVRLALERAAVVDVEADLVQARRLDRLARHVVGRVGDDRDGHHDGA